MSTQLDYAIEYADNGWSVFPVDDATKRPLIKWREFQNRIASEEEITKWWTRWPDANIALVTGYLSGLVVVDCDNAEALEAALSLGFGTPCRVRTKRGTHLYWKHPQDGEHHGNHQGGAPGSDWPKVSGLDFRGDGGYVIAPPSKGYEWALDLDLDDAPVWSRWAGANAPEPKVEGDEFSFNDLDLSPIRITKFDMMTEWDRTASYIKEMNFSNGRIPTGLGNSRNQRVFRYAAEQIKLGHYGPELRMKARAFMATFFDDPLEERAFEDSMASVEALERRNHPERFDESGRFIYTRADVKVDRAQENPRRLITVADADRLIEEGEADNFLIEPFLRPFSITQIYGYSGSGKTMFLQGAVYALAAGAPAYGPFEIPRAARVLYMDFELSRGSLGVRLKNMKQMFGDAGEKFMVWTPWLDNQNINFRDKGSAQALKEWIDWAKPEVVVLDTIRSAFSGLNENNAEEWSRVNELATRLRNAGYSVVMLHHSNKPGDDGLGREAGSTNQLTVLESQMRVTQVYRDKGIATIKAGIHDEYYVDNFGFSIMDRLEAKLPVNYFLSMVLELTYGKVRDRTELHDDYQWVGWGTHTITGEQIMVSSSSSKDKAREMYRDGKPPNVIAGSLKKNLKIVKKWLGIEEELTLGGV